MTIVTVMAASWFAAVWLNTSTGGGKMRGIVVTVDVGVVSGIVADTVTFWPIALLATTGNAVGVTVVMVAGNVVVRTLCRGVEIAVIALISAAGSTVVEIMATGAGLPLAASTVVAFSRLTGSVGKKPANGCSKRRSAPSKSNRQSIATIRARWGVTANGRRPTTWAERATRVMASSMRISIQPL